MCIRDRQESLHCSIDEGFWRSAGGEDKAIVFFVSSSLVMMDARQASSSFDDLALVLIYHDDE